MYEELQKSLNALDLPADWVGLRQVSETTTTRYVRNGKPQANGRSQTQGVMVEVLANGQFGYAATNRLEPQSIHSAAKMAYQQAVTASQWGVHKFTRAQRPVAVGQYHSPFLKPLSALSAEDVNNLLLRVCEILKVSDKIVKTSALAQTTETELRFVSTNGSDVYQKFLLVATDYAATAQDGSIIHSSE